MFRTDEYFADRFTQRQERGRKVKQGLWNFRCPYCGDSKKDSEKARGYIFRIKNKLRYKCHNCGESKSLHGLLKDHDRSLFKEYLADTLRQKRTPKQKEPIFSTNSGKRIEERFNPHEENYEDLFKEFGAVRICENPEAEAYLQNRLIPQKEIDSVFFFTSQFKHFTNKFIPGKFAEPINNDYAAIIIPLLDHEKKLIGFQGRSLDPNAKLRYITIHVDTSKPLLFGLNRLEKYPPRFVVEGPFDSLFLSNAIAVCGSSFSGLPFHDSIYVLDFEPRNPQIVKKYVSLLKNGKSVVIPPKRFSGADINDLVMEYGFRSSSQLEEFLIENTQKGLQGLLVLEKWRIA